MVFNTIRSTFNCREYHVLFKKVKKGRWEFTSAFNIMDDKGWNIKLNNNGGSSK